MAKQTASEKWLAKTRTRIIGGTLTQGQIRIIMQRISRALRGWEDTFLTIDEASEVMEMVETYKPYVTDEQARKGIDWLYAQAFTPKGAKRNTPNGKSLHALPEVADAIARAARMIQDNSTGVRLRLSGVALTGAREEHAPPTYTLEIDGYTEFSYSYGSWQSGTELRVFRVYRAH